MGNLIRFNMKKHYKFLIFMIFIYILLFMAQLFDDLEKGAFLSQLVNFNLVFGIYCIMQIYMIFYPKELFLQEIFIEIAVCQGITGEHFKGGIMMQLKEPYGLSLNFIFLPLKVSLESYKNVELVVGILGAFNYIIFLLSTKLYKVIK